jgi:hypothetical protein|tara:strand:+ start:4801 stop:5658 length:858 start_codon:yes stop_codon:yes gene_type:complete
MKIKHSKYKNTGILFELLVRQITADTLEGKDSPLKTILREYFVKTELGKEYKLYETLLKETSITETKADITISTLLESSKLLNRRILKNQKYNLIKRIQEHYDLNKFFNHKLPHYKVQAAFYTLLEIQSTNHTPSPEHIISNKMTILEYLTVAPIKENQVRDKVLEELDAGGKDLRILTYRILMEKFNDKYENLNNDQKEVLRELIYSIDNKPKLKEFYIKKSKEVVKNLKTLNKSVKDEVIKIKINEVISLIPLKIKQNNIADEDLINLLQYCDLAKELEVANG